MSDSTPHQIREVARQSSKTGEAARAIAARNGLQFATVMDLLKQGWTYTELMGGEIRWTR